MQTTKPTWWKSVIQYGSWIVAVILAIVDALMIREALISFLTWNQIRIQNLQRAQGLVPEKTQLGFTTEAFAQGAAFVLAVIVIAAVIWIEYYFRKGNERGVLFRRIGIVAGVEVGILLLSLILQVVFG